VPTALSIALLSTNPSVAAGPDFFSLAASAFSRLSPRAEDVSALALYGSDAGCC
jgi:hypothetical protein